MQRYITTLTAGTVLALACDSAPERTYTVAEITACETCEITFEPVVTLGGMGDSIGPTLFSYVARRKNGNFVVSTSDHPGMQLEYSSTGQIVRRFGRPGAGPGEYGFLTVPVIGPGDTVAILDLTTYRLTVLDSAGLPLRDHPVPQSSRALAWYGSRLLAITRSRQRTGAVTIHSLDPGSGSVIDSITVAPRIASSSETATAVVASLGNGSLLVGHSSALVFTLYDQGLREVERIDLSTSWFPPNDGGTGNPLVEAPAPRLLSVWDDSDGLLWVIAISADAQWAPAVTEGERPVRLSDSVELYDWIVAVFDLSSRRERARIRLDGPVVKDLSDEVLYGVRELQDGHIVLDALRPHLRN